MAERYVLALDLGSSGLRAHAVSTGGSWAVAEGASRPYRTLRPRGGDGLWRQLGTEDLRAKLPAILAEALESGRIPAANVEAISVTAQRGGTAFLGQDGSTIYLGPNTDLRAVFEGAAIDERLSGEVYARTGHLPSMFSTPAKLHWWREHHPRTARRIAKVATLGAWVVRELAGELAETRATLVEAGLADISDGAPATALLAELGIDVGLLPALLEEGQPTGKLTARAAELTGLPAGTPVFLAGPDAQTTALGSGCTEPGETMVAAGWSAPVQRVTSEPTLDVERRTWAGRYQLPDRWVAEANPGDTGATIDNIRRMLGRGITPRRFDELAAMAPERTQQVMALWGPRALDLSNPGMSLGGLLSPTPVTYDGIDRATVARVTLENVAFAIRECVELLENLGDSPANSIALGGGMAASAGFAAMLASALNTPVHRHDPRAAAKGASLVASRPTSDWATEARALRSLAETVEPDVSASLELGERYERWLRLRSGLDALAEDL